MPPVVKRIETESLTLRAYIASAPEGLSLQDLVAYVRDEIPRHIQMENPFQDFEIREEITQKYPHKFKR